MRRISHAVVSPLPGLEDRVRMTGTPIVQSRLVSSPPSPPSDRLDARPATAAEIMIDDNKVAVLLRSILREWIDDNTKEVLVSALKAETRTVG
jgi:hypothetical protein